MTDSRDRDGGPPVDSATFQEWVTHTAETRGVDEQELLNQLVSAFWVLDEMNGVMGDTDPFSGSDDLGGELSEHLEKGGPQPSDADGPSRSIDTPQSDQLDPDSHSEESASEVDEDALREEIRTMQESLHTQLEVVQAIGELRRQVSDLALDVEQQWTTHKQFSERITETLSTLEDRVETLDTEPGGMDEAAVNQLVADVTTDIERLETTHEEFETWIDGEFDQIEGLFERLLDADAEFEDRITEIEAEVESVTEAVADRDQLVTLRRKALQSGITKGVCESCDATIDLSMLDMPVCPDCGAELVEIETETRGWNPFAKPAIRTEPATPERFR